MAAVVSVVVTLAEAVLAEAGKIALYKRVDRARFLPKREQDEFKAGFDPAFLLLLKSRYFNSLAP